MKPRVKTMSDLPSSSPVSISSSIHSSQDHETPADDDEAPRLTPLDSNLSILVKDPAILRSIQFENDAPPQ